MWPDLTQDVPFALSPDQQNIAISSRTGQLTVSTIRGEEQILQLPSYGGRIRSVAYSHDGEYLAMTSEQGGIRVWNNVTSNVQWERAVTNDGEHGLLKGLDFSPDDQWLVTAGNDGKVIVREAATGEEIFSIEKDEVPTGFQFSADSQHIAMGVGNDVVLWDIESQEVVYQLVGHTESVNEVSFSPDQRMLASSGEDGNIILWDLETGEQLRMLSDDALPPEIIHMSMSPDGRLIGAIYSGDGIFPLVLWGVTDEG
jgi:WD40 repeat protein